MCREAWLNFISNFIILRNQRPNLYQERRKENISTCGRRWAPTPRYFFNQVGVLNNGGIEECVYGERWGLQKGGG